MKWDGYISSVAPGGLQWRTNTNWGSTRLHGDSASVPRGSETKTFFASRLYSTMQWIIWIIKLSFPFFSYSSASEAGPKRFCVALCKVAYFPTFLFFTTFDFHILLTFTLTYFLFWITSSFAYFRFSQTLSFAFFPTISFPPLLSFEKIASRQSSSCKLWVSLCRI